MTRHAIFPPEEEAIIYVVLFLYDTVKNGQLKRNDGRIGNPMNTTLEGSFIATKIVALKLVGIKRGLRTAV